MSNHQKQGLAAFVLMCLASAGIGWTAGYDFDYRSVGVALWVGCTLLLAIYVGAVTAFGRY